MESRGTKCREGTLRTPGIWAVPEMVLVWSSGLELGSPYPQEGPEGSHSPPSLRSWRAPLLALGRDHGQSKGSERLQAEHSSSLSPSGSTSGERVTNSPNEPSFDTKSCVPGDPGQLVTLLGMCAIRGADLSYL